MTTGAMAALGALASLHCAAMCGPLALAGTAACAGPARRGARWLAYLGARLVGYATVGAAVGAAGQHALCVVPVGTIQALASGLLAAFALWQGVRLVRPRPALVTLAPPRRRAALAALADALPRRGAGLGVITAFLPCGALLGAYALAATTASPPRAAWLMAVFALTSAPGLLAPALARALPAVRTLAASPIVRACGWWLLAAWSALRPLVGGHHH